MLLFFSLFILSDFGCACSLTIIVQPTVFFFLSFLIDIEHIGKRWCRILLLCDIRHGFSNGTESNL